MSEGPSGFDLAKMLKTATEMKGKISEVQERLARVTTEGESGGGMVTVRVNGRGEVLAIQIDPSVVDADEVEMLQDLLVAAVNTAVRKSQERAKEEMQGEMSHFTGMLPFPGLFGPK